jgi:hypothetical protein
MQKGVILGCGNRSNAGMDTVTLKHAKTYIFILNILHISLHNGTNEHPS